MRNVKYIHFSVMATFVKVRKKLATSHKCQNNYTYTFTYVVNYVF